MDKIKTMREMIEAWGGIDNVVLYVGPNVDHKLGHDWVDHSKTTDRCDWKCSRCKAWVKETPNWVAPDGWPRRRTDAKHPLADSACPAS